MITETSTDWIGVEQVAAELNLSHREAWELVRRIGVPMIEAGSRKMARARFRREDWEARRDAAAKPAEPRRRQATLPAPRPAKAAPVTKANEIRKFLRNS